MISNLLESSGIKSIRRTILPGYLDGSAFWEILHVDGNVEKGLLDPRELFNYLSRNVKKGV